MGGDSASDLSRREEEVLAALLEDLTNKEAADRLHISERTVKLLCLQFVHQIRCATPRRPDSPLLPTTCYGIDMELARMEVEIEQHFEGAVSN